jgi:hypothetical protein
MVDCAEGTSISVGVYGNALRGERLLSLLIGGAETQSLNVGFRSKADIESGSQSNDCANLERWTFAR